MDSWTYDAIGNRLTNTVNGSTQTYTYQKIGANPNNWQRLTSDGVNSYTYDASGSTVTKTGFTFASDAENRLTSISGGVTATYQYDYQGRRSGRTVGASSTYLYRNLDLVQEAGATPADYVFGPGIDEPLAMSRGGQVYYYSTDGLGSVAAITNSAGTVQNSYLFDAWGQTRTQAGSLASPFAYTAREQGEAASLFYRARFYSPGVGRFLSEDPPHFPDGLTYYSYADNDPVSLVDASGLCPWNVRSRPSHDVPHNPLTEHWYFYNDYNGRSKGIGPIGGPRPWKPVPGRWETDENPNVTRGDHLLYPVPDPGCDCVDRTMNEPDPPPKYCPWPFVPWPDTDPLPCQSCQLWVNNVLLDCGMRPLAPR